MVAIPTYLLPVEESPDPGAGGAGGTGEDSINVSLIPDLSENTAASTAVSVNSLQASSSRQPLEEELEEVTVGYGEEESSTELWCPRRGATPEQLRQLQVITLVVIGLIGLLIVSFLLLCMFYKNERLLEKLPWRKKRVQKMKESGREISLALNTTLQAVPSLRIVPSAIDYLTKTKGKHFPTHKTMLVDIGCRMVAGAASLHVPLGISPSAGKRSDSKSQVATHLSSGAPDPNSRPRSAVNDSMMRRHHNTQCTGMGLSDLSRLNAQDQVYMESSDESWEYEESDGAGSEAEEQGPVSDEDEFGVVAESRRGARGEKGNTVRCKNKYSDQYGSSMAKRGKTSDLPITTPHEVSYMSGRFW